MQNDHPPERYLTLDVAAKRLGLPYFKLQRAIRAGIVPAYTFFNGRILVRISEIERSFKAVRHD